MRVMSLDVGDRTIGVALSDETGIVALPLTVIRRSESLKRDIIALRKLVQDHGVGTIVVGIPLMLTGAAGIQAQKVESFIETLRRRISVPVVTWDERLSTSEVEKVLIEADQSRAKRKAAVDKLAAAVILQAYLDRSRAHVGRQEGPDENV